MPPFKYEAFVNPYIGSISELMGKGDEAKAQALLRIGEIQARAAEQRGQAWGNAVQGVGNIVSKAITDYNDPKLRMQKIELAKAEEADRLRRASTVLSSQTIPSTISTNVPGVPFEGATVNVVPNERGIGSKVFGAADFGARILPPKPQSVFGSVDIGKTMVEPDSTIVQSAGPNVSRFVDQSTQMLKVKDFQNALSGLVDPKTGKGFSLESIASRLKPLIDINESLIDYDAKKSAFDKSQQVGFGTLANSILAYVDQNPGSRMTDIAQVAAAAWGDRLGNDKIASFLQDLKTLSSSQQRAKLQGLKSAAEAQMPMKVLSENSQEVGAFGTVYSSGLTKPLPERTAALQLLNKAQADFDLGIKNGSIPAGTNFTEWYKKTTPDVSLAEQNLDTYARSIGLRDRNGLTHAQIMAYNKQNAINTHIEGPPTPHFVTGGDGNVYAVDKRTNTGERVLYPDGSPMGAPLSTSTRTMSEGAKAILPHITDLRADADKLDALGLFGPLQSRISAALAKMGTLDFSDSPEAISLTQAKLTKFGADLDKEISQDPMPSSPKLSNRDVDRLVGRFTANLKLMASGVGRVHGGARGGGSIQMINYMTDLLSANSSIGLFQGRLDGVESYMKTYANPGGNAVIPPRTASPSALAAAEAAIAAARKKK